MMEWLRVLVLMFVCMYSVSSIEMQRDFDLPIINDFDVVWNVPTEICKDKINFEEKLKSFGITVNSGDKFRGDKIVILYDPGAFPAMIKDLQKQVVKRNGGIPQKGNVTEHLEVFKEVMENLVPENFDGLGVIDFETWRPVFRQNWNDQLVYKTMSIDLVKNENSLLTDQQVNETAAKNFEEAAKKFMEQTLKEAEKLRPNAKWGFYGFPYCYNFRVDMTPECPVGVDKENDEIRWMFEASSAFYPSVYVSTDLTAEQQKGFVIGKLNEAWRVVSSISQGKEKFPPVFPYFWLKYNDKDEFVSKSHIKQALEITKKYKMGGAVIWGASRNVDTEKKCQEVLSYLEKDLGPAVLEVKGQNNQNSDQTPKTLSKRDASRSKINALGSSE